MKHQEASTASVVKVSELETRFMETLAAGVRSFAEAGKILVELIESDPDAMHRLRTKRNIPASLLRTMERVGRGLMLPEMFSEPGLARLPISEQKLILAGPVDMLTFDGHGEPTTLKVDLMTASSEVRQQVVNGNHIRTVAEQRAYVEARQNINREATSKAATTPWRVVGKVIRVSQDVDLTQGDLITMQRALMK